MKKKEPFDRAIPGYTEVSTWPIQPDFPEEICGIWVYRDGGTVGITIKGKNEKNIEFFFERVLGRLCYGLDEKKDNAAFIKKNSILEKEIYNYLESARKKLNTRMFSKSEIQLFNNCFRKYQVYTGF
ncbi:MAG: hypothetical protein KAG56_10780 [Sulfurovaceae bacterium]|nr:hypothetical protein [Sulfurovaceae bacterium]